MQYLLKKYAPPAMAVFLNGSFSDKICFFFLLDFCAQGSGRWCLIHAEVAFDLFSERHSAPLVRLYYDFINYFAVMTENVTIDILAFILVFESMRTI